MNITKFISILVFLTGTSVQAQEQLKIVDVVDPSVLVKQYLSPFTPNIPIIEELQSNIPGSFDIKKWKQLHWDSNDSRLNLSTDLTDPQRLGLNYNTDNSTSGFQYDGNNFQFSWTFKKTFGGPKQ